MRPTVSRSACATSASAIVALCVAVLTGDYLMARARAPRDDALIRTLQQQVKSAAAVAPQLDAEFQRVTAWRHARKLRDAITADILMAAAALFLLTVQRPGRRLPSLPRSGPGAHAKRRALASRPAVDAAIDLAFVDRSVARLGRTREAAIPLLQAIQSHYRYLPDEALRRVSEITEITPAQIAGTSSFYGQFRRSPTGKHLVKVCHGTACHVAGARQITEELRRNLAIPDGTDTDPSRTFTLEEVACLGCCSLAPVLMVDQHTVGKLTPARASDALEKPVANGKKTGHKRRWPVPLHLSPVFRVGLGSCGISSGAEAVRDALIHAAGNGAVKGVGCNGMCHQEPMVEVVEPGGHTALYGNVTPQAAHAIARRHLSRFPWRRLEDEAASLVLDPAAYLARQQRIVLENCGAIDPLRLDDYLARGGYQALADCRKEFSAEQVIAAITDSGLRGRGGAGFPTGRKWSLGRSQPGNLKYVICNGDEGDPGAFMDRLVLESDPHRVLEGLAIAAYAIGAAEAYFYIRAEYPQAVRHIREAIRQAEERGLLGSLHAEVREGAGAFVCGEETALIQSLEGNRGMPRLRPPYPVERGFRGHPTIINNVETLACVPWIIRHGAAAFAAFGTAGSRGTKVFALAGKIRRGGLVEVPMGVTIREVVEEIGGGIQGNHRFKAVQLGGPSGGCIPASLADTPIDYDALAQTGAIMGSGGLVVLDDRDCMVDISRFFLRFTQSESCGKCTFCRVGTKRMLEILERLCEGRGRPDDLEKLEELAQFVSRGSLCGLGQTAPNPVLTTLRYFRDEYEAHLHQRRCPAGRCPTLIRYRINDTCIGCTLCAQACPVGAIPHRDHEKHVVDEALCTRCDMCRQVCQDDAVEVVSP